MYEYYEYFSIQVDFEVDEKTLQNNYFELLKKYHPDKTQHDSAFDQQQAVMLMAKINDAYQVLNNPIKRMEYLLKENGVKTDDESQTYFPQELLMQQFEWREKLDEIDGENALSQLEELQKEAQNEQDEVFSAFEKNFKAQEIDKLSLLLAKARFVKKLLDEINVKKRMFQE